MSHPLTKNFLRRSRELCLTQAKICRNWRKTHESLGQWTDAANVHQAMLGYMASFRQLSRQQKEIDERWKDMPR